MKVNQWYKVGRFYNFELENGIDIMIADIELKEMEQSPNEEYLFRSSENKLYIPVLNEKGGIEEFKPYKKSKVKS